MCMVDCYECEDDEGCSGCVTGFYYDEIDEKCQGKFKNSWL